MKSPSAIKLILRRQWENASCREARLLGGKDAWPVTIAIGRPSPKKLSANLDAVKRHVEAWRKIKIGNVLWTSIRYRATADAVEIPTHWQLSRPSEWLEACGDTAMRDEYKTMEVFAEQADPLLRSLIVRRRSLWRGKLIGEVVQAARVAMALEPDCAAGRPLRMLSLQGVDTKFFERNAALVTALLDVRFDGEVGRMGLEAFLGALAEGEHWLLLIDLDGSLLPFKKMRVRSDELRGMPINCERLLIVENETCQHMLPPLPQTVAVLGTGFDLGWLEGDWLATKRVAYWGDIDTWGLQLLAKARKALPHLTPLLMTCEVFDEFCNLAVIEPVIADVELPSELSASEQQLYRRLLQSARGRLEQEFLPEELCRLAIEGWAGGMADIPVP